MLETDIDFTAATDDEIVAFIVVDLSRFHEEQSDAQKVKRGIANNLAEGAFFLRSRHGFALIRPSTDDRRYAVLNYLFSCVRGHGTHLIERVREVCKHEPMLTLRCYTDDLRDYYAKRGFALHSSSDGGHTMNWQPVSGTLSTD